MAGPARNPRTPPQPKVVQPPRPPNAWILYRTDRAKEIGRKAQADVSREISAMWRNELPVVRAQYERMADIKKAEHHAMYPEYRFQPVKREEKERLREEKRLEKERRKQAQRQARANTRLSAPVPVPAPAPAAPSPTPPSLYFPMDNRYGPCGPSPPISAAPSPVSEPPAYPHTPISSSASPAMPPSSYAAEPLSKGSWSTTSQSDFSWTGTLSSDFDVEAMLSSTGDPSIFQLSGFDPQSLLDNPTGNLEISLAPFEMPSYMDSVPHLSDLGLFTQPQQDGSDELASFLASLESTSPSDLDQFLNLDGHSPEAQPPNHTPYVPPSGASQSTNRRVGATWAHPIAFLLALYRYPNCYYLALLWNPMLSSLYQ
ncbi:hypothetical protein C8F01DRAFT_1104064 [Mycena amicta]|nr:hypothetical protein C8F01DRAFT_1104064 [Mycena amicta]